MWSSTLLLLAAGCGEPRQPAALPAHPNLVVIDIDSLRADRVGLSRDGRLVAPALDHLAKQSTTFSQAWSQSGWTTPALLSILRGRMPLLHDGDPTKMKLVGRDEHTVPEVLATYGYQTTLLFSLHRWMDDKTAGLGFQKAEYLEEGGGDLIDRMEAQVDATLDAQKEPFFLMVHQYDLDKYASLLPKGDDHVFLSDDQGCTHAAYGEAWDELSPRLGADAAQAHVIEHYDATLAFYDAVLDHIVDALSKRRLLDHTIVVLVSNHAEDLFEHYDGVTHCSLYDSVLHIPLIVYDPSATPGRVVDAEVQTMDVGATLLDYAGVPADVGMDGRSLRGLVDGSVTDWPARPLYSATNQDNLSVRSDGWKLLRTDHPARLRGRGPCAKGSPATAPAWELYDLAADPGEQHDLYETSPERAAKAMEALLAWRDAQTHKTDGAPTYVVQGAVKQALQQQGYWSVLDKSGKPMGPAPGGTVGPPDRGGTGPPDRGGNGPPGGVGGGQPDKGRPGPPPGPPPTQK